MMRLKTRIVLVGMLTRLVVMSLLVGDVDGGSGALSGSSFAAVANNLSLLPLLQAVDRVIAAVANILSLLPLLQAVDRVIAAVANNLSLLGGRARVSMNSITVAACSLKRLRTSSCVKA